MQTETSFNTKLRGVFLMEYVLQAFISKLGKEDERFIKQLYTIVYKYLERRDRI